MFDADYYAPCAYDKNAKNKQFNDFLRFFYNARIANIITVKFVREGVLQVSYLP